MKVKQLIEQLQQFPEDADVLIGFVSDRWGHESCSPHFRWETISTVEVTDYEGRKVVFKEQGEFKETHHMKLVKSEIVVYAEVL